MLVLDTTDFYLQRWPRGGQATYKNLLMME